MSLPDLPPSLKSIKAYLEQGKLRASDPVVSYSCNLFALQEAMAIRSKLPKGDMGFIMSLMDHVESQKKTLGDLDQGTMQVQVENTAGELFQKADDADRGGNHGLQVAKDFLAAANIFEVCKQFMEGGDLPEDMAEKCKYGKWRFVELCKAAKERRPPAPPRGMEDGEGGDGLVGEASSGSGMGDAATVATPAAPPPTDVSPGGPPPSYMDLPPAAAGGGIPPGIPPGGTVYPPQVIPGGQPSFDAPSVPQTHQMPQQVAYGYGAPPAMPQYAAPAMPAVNPNFKPSTVAYAEAMGLCKSAADCLAFQDHVTAIASLQQAITLLTQPPAQSPP